jgi:hypothetical protein
MILYDFFTFFHLSILGFVQNPFLILKFEFFDNGLLCYDCRTCYDANKQAVMGDNGEDGSGCIQY